MAKKKIEFIPHESMYDTDEYTPVPAKKSLPEWYKKLSTYHKNVDLPKPAPNAPVYTHTGARNLTMKHCYPVFDALTSGYFIVLGQDLIVNSFVGTAMEPSEEDKDSTSENFSWNFGGEQINLHTYEQWPDDMAPEGFSKTAYKFRLDIGIKTPPGYSVLITHPFNRFELPFRTLTGVVDTDAYNIDINYPFFIKHGWEGVIERGTPIAQVLPFKREPWEMSMAKFDERKSEKLKLTVLGKAFRAYKEQFWSKKSYN